MRERVSSRGALGKYEMARPGPAALPAAPTRCSAAPGGTCSSKRRRAKPSLQFLSAARQLWRVESGLGLARADRSGTMESFPAASGVSRGPTRAESLRRIGRSLASGSTVPPRSERTWRSSCGRNRNSSPQVVSNWPPLIVDASQAGPDRSPKLAPAAMDRPPAGIEAAALRSADPDLFESRGLGIFQMKKSFGNAVFQAVRRAPARPPIRRAGSRGRRSQPLRSTSIVFGRAARLRHAS
jgi:hypothetical protein